MKILEDIPIKTLWSKSLSATFEELIMSLSEYLAIEIEPDVKGGFRLRVENKFDIQIELDSLKEKIYFVSSIYELSPGKFRENVLKSGLKANYIKDNPHGVLCYIQKQNQLALFYSLILKDVTSDQFNHEFQAFYEKAHSWNEALDHGQLAPLGAYKEMPLERPPHGIR